MCSGGSLSITRVLDPLVSQRLIFWPIMRCGWQIVEGFLYYFDFERATRMLKAIQANSGAGSVLLADHINDFTLSSLKVGTTPSSSF